VVVSSPSSGLSTTSSVVTLTIRSSVDNVVWRGYGLKWDVSSLNWQNATTFADPANFQQGDNVLLDDTAVGGRSLYLIGRIMPGSVTVSNINYTINGPGYLSWNMGLNLAGSAVLTLTTSNDYTGNTVIDGGSTLTLTGTGWIGNSSSILLGTNSTLNVSGRSDGTLTLNPTQTLKGNGTFNVTGSLVNNGTLEFNAHKASGVVTNDQLQGMTSIIYGGALKLDLSGEPLTAGDSLKLFNSAAYSGSFASIAPATPGTGLVWNTSALTTSGTLSVVSAINTNPTNITFAVTSGNLTLSWPTDHIGWTLQAQTNPIGGGISNNWVNVVGSQTNNQIVAPVNPTNNVFFRLIYP
jgi:autotransporter-associated beta strand protein